MTLFSAGISFDLVNIYPRESKILSSKHESEVCVTKCGYDGNNNLPIKICSFLFIPKKMKGRGRGGGGGVVKNLHHFLRELLFSN